MSLSAKPSSFAAATTSRRAGKFFAASELLELVKDRAWLVKVTNAVNQHWHKQNTRKKNHPANSSQNGHVTVS
jgi:molybdopterin synthase catalytic subunit